ncbi:hypothetical protein [Inquilinus sp. CAU 1745]|uniref:hypothetical protein n=1 Tax=Inquilinus sp. CAU 1745 TaxID=3140369 RepID=UPI00325B025A
MGRGRFAGGDEPGAALASVDGPWMPDQVRHDGLGCRARAAKADKSPHFFFPSFQRGLESMGRGRFIGGEGPAAALASVDGPWMPDQVRHDGFGLLRQSGESRQKPTFAYNEKESAPPPLGALTRL